MPYTPADDAVPAVFASIAGQYDLIEAYDGCQPDDPWRIYDPAAPSFVNTLTQINTSQGLWVHTTAAPTLALTGKPLAADVTLSLCAGWNLIGYPSASTRDVATVLASISGQYDLVEGYDGTNPGRPVADLRSGGAILREHADPISTREGLLDPHDAGRQPDDPTIEVGDAERSPHGD